MKRNSLYYALAVMALGGSAVAMQFASLTIIKKGLPLRKPLTDMSPSSLGDYELITSRRLSTDIVSELGTDEYIEWNLRDRRITDPDRAALSLFVTYYTNVQDQVPHVPEECHIQGGGSLADDDEIELVSKKLNESFMIRRLGFDRPKLVGYHIYVYYVISVNGNFYTTRNGARPKISDPRDTHLYYSKVEISFPPCAESDLPELDRRALALMDATIAELFESHWPPRGAERGGYEAIQAMSSETKTKNERESTNAPRGG